MRAVGAIIADGSTGTDFMITAGCYCWLIVRAATAMAQERGAKQYRYLDILINIFVVVLVVSNLIAPKFVAVGWFRFSAAQLLFPITYIFGDVFTEVYGYSASRKAIWTGFM